MMCPGGYTIIYPCLNCKRRNGYYHKRGRSKAWLRICKHCDLKYDVRVRKEPTQ